MDAEHFKREFLPFHRKLYHVAYRMLENQADAEDLVQEAYLKLWSKRDGLSVISNPEAFSITLVKNMCLDVLRSGKNMINRQMLDLSSITEKTHTDNWDAQDDLSQIKNIIASLPEQQQKIVVLRDIKECSYEEIERLTGLNAINIRVLLSRGRKKVREQFNRLNNYENRGS
ncbi:MAG: RNA polymerase sigma factor [Bacteroides sp.]|nr:RNA polymerase sigma factor [Bacteroides sp.]